MDNVKHLSEVLKSQINLYSEMADLLTAEKRSIIAWAVDETIEIARQKEELLRREHIQEEARNALLAKIAAQHSIENIKLRDIVKLAKSRDPELGDELESIMARLIELIGQINAENISLRMLYNTNSKLISEFFLASGMADGNSNAKGYGQNTTTQTSRLHNVVG